MSKKFRDHGTQILFPGNQIRYFPGNSTFRDPEKRFPQKSRSRETVLTGQHESGNRTFRLPDHGVSFFCLLLLSSHFFLAEIPISEFFWTRTKQ